MTRPLVLVTNDDGVSAPGIQALRDAMARVGRAVVVAPERDNSAVSHSLTMHRPLRVKTLAPDVYTLDGTPTDCVILAIEKLLPERPALVASGINAGGNLCDDIHYSGTVSAAIEGTMLGIPSVAVSMPGDGPYHFEAAAMVAERLARLVLDQGLPRDTLLNINVPNDRDATTLPIAFTRQGRRTYADVIQETLDPWGRPHYWIGGGTPSWDQGDDTDSRQVRARRVSVTPIHLDLTNYAALERLRREWGQP